LFIREPKLSQSLLFVHNVSTRPYDPTLLLTEARLQAGRHTPAPEKYSLDGAQLAPVVIWRWQSHVCIIPGICKA
jgi:hypothetical protein